MPVNTSIWQRSGEIIILFATLTALGSLSRSASADPSWNDERAQIASGTKAAPAMDKWLAELVDPIAGAPVDTPNVAAAKPAVVANPVEAAEIEPIDDLPPNGQDTPKRDAKAGDTPVAKSAANSVAMPFDEPIAAKTDEPAAAANKEKVATSEHAVATRAAAVHMEPNAGIECVAGCYDAKPTERIAVVRKPQHLSSTSHLRTRHAESAQAGMHRKRQMHEATDPRTTLASAGAIWPKRRALCMANCTPEDAARTRAVYDAIPELGMRVGVVLPEAWIGVPLQQFATSEALTVTGTTRPTSAIVLHTQMPGILRNIRMR